MKPHHRLLLSLSIGALAGLLLHDHGELAALQQINHYFIEPLGQLFLRAIFMIVTPMVVSGLIIGVYQLGSHSGLARVAKRTLFFTVLASSASVFLGIGLVNLLQPGVGLNLPASLGQGDELRRMQVHAAEAKPMLQTLLELIPKNPFDAAAKAMDGGMLSLMLFSLLFGAALAFSQQRSDSRCLELMEEIYAACLWIVDAVMKMAPWAVCALVFQSTFKFGWQIVWSLGFYVFVVVLGLLLQQGVVYSLLLKTFSRFSPWVFFKQCREIYLYAFATASSNATLPRTLELAEQELQLSPAVSRFVLTIGSTANQNGTALFEGVTVLFLAQVYGLDLNWSQQFQVVLMAILAGIGTAGVPGGSLPLIMILIQQIGIPAEGMGLILGVDRFLDMCRTTLNVSGDLVIAALVDEAGQTAGKKKRPEQVA